MNTAQDQSTMVGTPDGASTNMESEASTSTYADKEQDLEASPIGYERRKEQLEGGEVEGPTDRAQAPTDDAPSKDFPDLAPSKSMDFPDGQLFIESKLIDRWQTSLADGRRRIFMFVLLFR